MVEMCTVHLSDAEGIWYGSAFRGLYSPVYFVTKSGGRMHSLAFALSIMAVWVDLAGAVWHAGLQWMLSPLAKFLNYCIMCCTVCSWHGFGGDIFALVITWRGDNGLSQLCGVR